MNNKLERLGKQMLNELYSKSTPKTTWAQVVKKYSGKHEAWYEGYKIDQTVAEKILDKYEKKCKNKFEKNSISFLFLNFCPVYKKVK